ncbi:serine/threonine protein kinase [Thermomonospora echinospora]|uniref:non-specific serine/threonine protein kinase n=1 Tax=Thermomonospora echinospora TaxID=1992 RepID=A0A1H6CRT2_9ACTN|nr:serine/threonine-protein kinase [Thermomonospora echinospora]SEG75730.1 serine/threonine protein kinase [Thermomonospora echinospora]
MTSADLVLDSRYRLLRRLATGGMGEVWEGSDELLNRPVAVKLLRQEHVGDEHARARFRAEARYAAALQHGGIAQVYDYGEHDDRAYLVMELVPGESLSRILARTGGLTPEATLDVVAQAARALQVAHTAGIIHRDVKPGNLMVTAEGTVKITDFGIARGLNVSTLTQTGMVMGTAHYVSPEQASGQPITFATDLYSLGVVAFECLTGRPPFDAEQPVAIALKHVREAPPELSAEVPDAVRALVRALLAKDPQERPGDAQAVADEAYMIHDALLAGEPVTGSFDDPFAASSGYSFGDDLFDDVFEDPPGGGHDTGPGGRPGEPAPTVVGGFGTGAWRRNGASAGRSELDGDGAPDTLASAKPWDSLASAKPWDSLASAKPWDSLAEVKPEAPLAGARSRASLAGGRAEGSLAGAESAAALAGTRSTASVAAAGSPDTLAGVKASLQRRTVLVIASVATGVLLLGVVAAGTIWRGSDSASADYKKTRDQAPAAVPESQSPVPSRVPSPAGMTGPPSWPSRRPDVHNSTASTTPTPSASPTGRLSPSPTRPSPPPEEPTPTPTESNTSSPSPVDPPPDGSSPGEGQSGSE